MPLWASRSKLKSLHLLRLLHVQTVLHDLRLVHTDLKPENILLVDSDYITIPYKVSKQMGTASRYLRVGRQGSHS